ncbi:PREDICTED: WD repeat-containing protein 44-like [Camelina sativa]|uniref:WD repeat-containing protein 44-like n=1 Tax=Camelina sativa TaxID=90675 RepID=A0ABM0U5K7_CAMSA|nr:PREDICTED: WD repeat-containing protein 44-like [Camelina sativa]
MMGTRGNEEEEDLFSDAREEVSSVSDCNSEVAADDFVQATGDLHLWTMNPESVDNRRQKFFQSMGFSFKKRNFDLDLDLDLDRLGDSCSDHVPVSKQLNSVFETNNEEEDEEEEEKLLRNESISSRSSVSSVSSLSTSSLAEAFSFRGSFQNRAKNIDDQILLTRDYSSNSSSIAEGLSESGSSRSGSYGDFQNSPMSRYEDSPKKGGAKGWLKKLGVLTHILDKNEDYTDGESMGSSVRRQLTRVQSFKKQFKELSSLCIGQEFSAHDGSVVVMKFSHDGKYLASAGEDCVVRVWNITEDERRDNEFEVVESDSSSSCVYFGMNDKSQIEPLKTETDKVEKSSRGLLRKKSESTCAVLPSKVFSISETPQHEFQGHKGEILDLSWSEKGFLLSSSVDETVRLWRVGSSDECIRVFSHKSFVTCVAFNPVDDNYFISGSIDGKVRIWDVSRFRVVDYTDIREIVTALCYRPDAKGAVVGSMTGECRFYHTIDNQLQLDREISLHGKKKAPSKRITGFQFFPGDSDKLMVTSADSQIRIICGVDTICKLKKASSLGTTLTSPTFASFTSDGKHIVSTIEDSGIHVWDYSQPNKKASSQKPKTIRSYEGFLSHNVSVAIPWLGQQGKEDNFIADLEKTFAHFPAPMDYLSPNKGGTTWPEEKLGVVVAGAAAAAVSATVSSRSKLRLLRSVCQNVNTSSPHLWGLVIVTATWDGRIRVFHNYGLPIRV